MDDHFDICPVFEISKSDIARLTCTPFWEVFAYFLIAKGPIFDPISGLGKSLINMKNSCLAGPMKLRC